MVSPTSYMSTQQLGAEMRTAGVELFRFPSARNADGGTNVAAFTPAVLHQAQPQRFERWHCTVTRELVELTRGDLTRNPDTHAFPRAQFLVGGALPKPAT